MPLNTSCTCTDAAYRIEHGTVSENELNISNKLLDTLVMAEVCFAQTTAHSPQVHRIQYDLVVIRNLEHTHITCAYITYKHNNNNSHHFMTIIQVNLC